MANDPFVGLNGIQPPHRQKFIFEEYSFEQLASRSTSSSLDLNENYFIEWEYLPEKALGIILSHLEPFELAVIRETCWPWCNFVDKNLLTVRPKAWPNAPPLNLIFPSLTRLDLSEMCCDQPCMVATLESASRLSVLKRLDLVVDQEDGQCHLPTEVAALTNLRIIVASAQDESSECSKISLPKEMSTLCCLEEMRFKYLVPDFTSFPFLLNLSFLRLGKRTLGSLENLGLMTNLQGLELVQDRLLTSIPSEVCSISGLRHLDLSRNRLVELPQEMGCLHQLTALIANRNCLSDVPDSIQQLQKVVRLDLAHNMLHELPPHVLQLRSLQYLDLSGNQLEDIPNGPLGSTSIQTLILDFNNIDKLGLIVGKMASLRYLSVQNNILEDIAPEIGNLADLTHLYLSANHLVSIPGSISGLTSLLHISLDQNCLEVLPKSVSCLESLSTVDISFNRFQTIPFPLSIIENLRDMYVEHNPFSSVGE